MNTHPFRTVVVGTGFIGPVHVEALRRIGVEVVGVVGSNAEKSRLASQRLGLVHRYDLLDDALDDPRIDVIHITSPNRLHFEQAAASLRAGKHVVCEKPLAMNSTESRSLCEIARESGKRAAVAYNIRFYPLCCEVAAQIQSGAMGSFLHVHGSYVQDWLLHESDFNWRVLEREGGPLRAVADIGTHWLDLIQFVVNSKIVAVCADLRTIHPQRIQPKTKSETFSDGTQSSIGDWVDIETEDCGSILLQFADGANGALWVSQTTAGRKNCLQFEIAGTKKSFSWNSEAPNQLSIGYRNQPNEMLIRDPSLLLPSASQTCSYPGGHNEGFPETFKQLFRSFYATIASDAKIMGPRKDLPAYPTFEDGHREVLLCEAILESHRTRRWIEVPKS